MGGGDFTFDEVPKEWGGGGGALENTSKLENPGEGKAM